MPNISERTPLLDDRARNFWAFGPESRDDFHTQFCKLVGVPPSNLPPNTPVPPIGPKTLYGRALKMRRSQSTTYALTASISNTLLLTQVVIGAAVTGLGASSSSHILITVFGALNTIIAGVTAYLKSRGQPMRARMYRDDLERVVDEIENSEIMWLGISKGMHGYEAINTDGEVTVRSEVARLTRLYDRAVRSNTMNNPDMYMAGTGIENTNLALRKGPLPSGPIIPPAPIGIPAPTADIPAGGAAPAPAPVLADPDESPATAPPKPPPKDDSPKQETPKDDKKPSTSSSTSAGDKSPTDSTEDKPNGPKDGDTVAGASRDDNDLLNMHGDGSPTTSGAAK